MFLDFSSFVLLLLLLLLFLRPGPLVYAPSLLAMDFGEPRSQR